jgi:hypothetical protein
MSRGDPPRFAQTDIHAAAVVFHSICLCILFFLFVFPSLFFVAFDFGLICLASIARVSVQAFIETCLCCA